MDKKLEVKNLQISFRTQAGNVKAVRDISFDLYTGETLAIVGESGSGKSVTSKAIMGILAGNSIVEGGEILYDGQNLLKIDEEHFHKIRGDKIAMIFQDPMSSLNPIMRIGQQLTEAMILKAKAGKKNARNEFNTLLSNLKDNIISAHSSDASFNQAETIELCKTFDNFCIKANQLELAYNDAHGALTELGVDLEDAIFLSGKDPKFNAEKNVKEVIKDIEKCYHPFVLVKDEEFNLIYNSLVELSKTKPIEKKNFQEVYTKLNAYVEKTLEKKAPNFFRLGFYMYSNPKAEVYNMNVDELDEMCLNYLMENFMTKFISLAETGVKYSHDKSISDKKALFSELQAIKEYFESGNFEEKEAIKKVTEFSKKLDAAIDRLETKKNSTEYTFASAVISEVKAYFNGIKRNPIEEKIYLRNKAKFDKLIEKGKTPDWSLKPQIIVDLDLRKANINRIVNTLVNSFNHDFEIDADFNTNVKVVEIIDYLKEQASKVVVKMSKKIAKSNAIKLLEEVGIPEPTMRFNQYPFELSGGMRQRIVIAIALSANPDILICDEPTTALDVTIQSQILELINKIKEERHLSVIFITHNLGVVANMADRIAVMYAGKIVEYGTSEEIFYDPRHPYTWALLSSMPDLHTKDKLESIPGTPPNMIYPPKGDAFAARNKYAMDIDFEMQPPLFEVTPTHFAATWLLHPNAPKVEVPKIIRDRVERIKKEMEANGD